MPHIKMTADTGNDFFKTDLTDDIKASVIAIQRQQDIFDPVTFNSKQDEAAYVKDLLNRLDVVVQSPSINTNQRLFVGAAAVASHLPLTAFDVNSLSGKADTDLTLILILSHIAGAAVQRDYATTNKLPERLNVTVDLATALPITEGKRAQVIEHYRERFLASDHVVTLRNFQQLITVSIHFDQVEVLLEGEAAQYAIHAADSQLQKAITTDFTAHYPELAKQTPIADLINDPNVLSIDIGGKTTDIAVFNANGLNLQASSSTLVGYGKSLSDATDELTATGFNIGDRATLQDFITSDTTPLNAARKQRAQNAIDHQLDSLTAEIDRAFSKALRLSSANVELIWVHGGGSTPLESRLRPVIAAKSKEFTGGTEIPAIFITEPLGQKLNEIGLELALAVMDA